jgi:hypothetical protein
MNQHHHRSLPAFLRYHSLSVVTLCILGMWVTLYSLSDGNGHLGSFFGNSIADWSGSFFIIVGTKYFFERGSAESRKYRGHFENPILEFLRAHSLTLVLLASGFFWLRLYLKSDPNSKWGQVYGNLVSEWFQTIGLVWMTKSLVERGSKESNPS